MEGGKEGGVGSCTKSKGLKLQPTPEPSGPYVSHFERNTFLEEIFVGRGKVSLGGGKFVTTTFMPRG